MNETCVEVLLYVGDVLVTGEIYEEITRGMIACNAVTGECSKDNSTTTIQISYEEACSRHDNGKTVFESSEDFIGTWRIL